MESDIVARLRESDGGYFMRKMFTEAADEIERLQRESRERELQRDHARYLYLREIAHSDAAMMRDEARKFGWILDITDDPKLSEDIRDA